MRLSAAHAQLEGQLWGYPALECLDVEFLALCILHVPIKVLDDLFENLAAGQRVYAPNLEIAGATLGLRDCLLYTSDAADE